MEGRKKKNGKKSVDNKLLRSVTGYARDTRCDDRESWGQKCFSLLFLKGRREEGGSHVRDLIRRQGRTRVSRIPAAQLVEILLTTIRKYRTVKEEEEERKKKEYRQSLSLRARPHSQIQGVTQRTSSTRCIAGGHAGTSL